MRVLLREPQGLGAHAMTKIQTLECLVVALTVFIAFFLGGAVGYNQAEEEYVEALMLCADALAENYEPSDVPLWRFGI